jgi:hypothetical protein
MLKENGREISLDCGEKVVQDIKEYCQVSETKTSTNQIMLFTW